MTQSRKTRRLDKVQGILGRGFGRGDYVSMEAFYLKSIGWATWGLR